MIKSSIVMCLCLLSSPLMALQYIPMDCTSVVKVNLSYRNHNRIGIQGDRIKKAFFRSTHVAIDVEEESGQIFVQALSSNCPRTTISVISNSGDVQELELCFEDCLSEVILLQPIPNFLERTQGIITCEDVAKIPSVIEQTEITNLVEGFIQGIIPEGYTSVDDPESPVTIANGLKLQRLSRLISNQQIVFVYRLHNFSGKAKSITECQVNVLDGDWVFLDRYNLSSDESSLVLIGCHR